MTARRNPDEPTFAEDDPRAAWTVRSVDLILSAHAAALSPVDIARDLSLPVREIREVVRRRCEAHEHTFLGTVAVDAECGVVL